MTAELPPGMLTHDEIRWIAFPDPLPSPASVGREDERSLLSVENLVIADMAAGEAAALERVQELLQENGVRREMLSQTLTMLAQTTAHLEAARRTIADQRAHLRRYTQ